MYDYDLIFWGAVFAVMVIAELASFQLISIWFAIGALVTFIMALCGAELGIQMLVFTVVSIVLLLFTRPLLKKFAVKKIQPTNIELDVGKTAVVIEEINNKIDTGRAKLNGVDWKAVSADDSIIPEGSIVRIDNIRGTKLYVTLYKEIINL